MPPFLHILVRVEDDGSLHALGAFTSKDKQLAYQRDAELTDKQVRLDFYNGPFDGSMKVVYAGHRRWNMDQFQLGGYFESEGEAWSSVTLDGYVSVLRIDTTFEDEKRLQQEALELYAKLQKKWRLTSYEDLVNREGSKKATANITLRFYEDALESFKPKTRRDVRALYAFVVVALLMPVAIYYYASSGPSYGENLKSVKWLPSYAENISFYRSKQVEVYEFKVSPDNFRKWASSIGMSVKPVTTPVVVSRYKAYMPVDRGQLDSPETVEGPDASIDIEALEAWQSEISVTVRIGLLATGADNAKALFDPRNRKAFFEKLPEI